MDGELCGYIEMYLDEHEKRRLSNLISALRHKVWNEGLTKLEQVFRREIEEAVFYRNKEQIEEEIKSDEDYFFNKTNPDEVKKWVDRNKSKVLTVEGYLHALGSETIKKFLNSVTEDENVFYWEFFLFKRFKDLQHIFFRELKNKSTDDVKTIIGHRREVYRSQVLRRLKDEVNKLEASLKREKYDRKNFEEGNPTNITTLDKNLYYVLVALTQLTSLSFTNLGEVHSIVKYFNE